MRGRVLLVVGVVAAASISAGQSGLRDDGAGLPENNAVAVEEYEPSWLLVQLDRSIGEVAPDGTLPLETGLQDVDRLIRETGIQRIEMALPVSSRNPADPEAFRRYGFDRTYKFFVPPGADIPPLVDRFSGARGVRLAEPDYLLHSAQITPNDSLFDTQWGLHNTGQAGGDPDCDVDAPEAWETSTGGEVLVAILDTGADLDHEDLVGKLWTNTGEIAGNGIDDDGNGYIDDVHGWNFTDDNGDVEDQDPGGHGTHVASIAAANTDNSVGIAGACWNCRVILLAVASVNSSAFVDALVWGTDRGARVVNISQHSESTGYLQLSGVGYAYDAGVVVVACTGNTLPLAGPVEYPAAYLETIAVGASNLVDSYMYWSNYGEQMDVLAPGVNMAAADVGGGYGSYDGTSYATPVVTGLVGIIETLNPSVGREEARHLVQAGADDQGDPGFDVRHGWGRANMDRSLQATEASMTLRVEGSSATRVYFDTPIPLADSYDFARGALGSLSESHMGVDAGDLTCLENDSSDADTAGNEDTESPAPGEGFFYLARFNAAPGAGSYGGSSRNRDRMVFTNRTEAAWTAESDQEEARFACSYSAGDVNNDGYDDVIVGAMNYEDVYEDEGAAFLYLGSPTGLAASHSWMVTSGQQGSDFGYAAGSAGDVNGDGYDDVVVGSRFYDNGEIDEGMAFVYHGGPSGPSNSPDWTAEGNQVDGRFGEWAQGVGDVNGDGYDDVLVSAPYYDAGQTNEGRVFLFYGSESGLSPTAGWTTETDQAYAYLGFAFVDPANVNGDDYYDIVVGSEYYDNGENNEGRVFVYHGSSSGPGSEPDQTLEIDVPDAWFGIVTSGAGDVDGDSFDDVIVGALNYGNGQSAEGGVFLYLGSADGLQEPYSWSFEPDQVDAGLGWVSSSAGDINDDGYDDIVAGAWSYDDLRTDEGKVWVFLGSPTGPVSPPDSVWSMTGRQSRSGFGSWGGTAGDVNGDGYADIVLGADVFDNVEFEEGRVYLYHGPLTETPSTDCAD